MSILRRFAALLAAACCVLVVSVGSASAGPVADDGSSAGSGGGRSIFATLPFALGEVDLSTLGVSASELATVGLVGATASSAGDGPNMFIVDDDHAQCPNAAYETIQEAVDASGPGDQVKVCAGIYMEQVRIMGSAHDGLRLFSERPLQATIKMPLGDLTPHSVVYVDGANDVDIRHFTISGPFVTPPQCFNNVPDRHTGVRLAHGSMTLYGNHITEIRHVAFTVRGCQDGFGVQIGRRAEGQFGTATIRNNLIDLYQKGGIIVDGPGTYALVTQNDINGDPGLSGLIAQNGVQVSREARADVDHNEIRDNAFCCNANDDAASGVLLFEPNSDVSVDHNDLVHNGLGIALTQTLGVEVSHNVVRDGINSGIEAFASTAQNTIAYNKATRNVPDCADDSPPGPGTPPSTSNFWIKDFGLTQNKPGLCKNAT